MSATNKTTYYELPVFIATDEPKWLTDWNGAINIIDGAIAEAKTAADNAQTTANANALAISGLSDSVSTISTALGTLTTTVNTLNGTVNTITELIGNGTPTTTDKTIIGAINELKAEIDALAPGGEVSAAEVSYDNTSSQLTADDVQDAIDELNTKIESIQPSAADHGIFELWKNSDVSVAFAGQDVVLTDFDSTKYDAIIITAETIVGESFGAKWYEFDKDVLSISQYSGMLHDMFTSGSPVAAYEASRSVEFSLTGTTLTVTFGSGTTSAIGGTAGTDNTRMVPVRILGLTHNA